MKRQIDVPVKLLNALASLASKVPAGQRESAGASFNDILELHGSGLDKHKFLVGHRPTWSTDLPTARQTRLDRRMYHFTLHLTEGSDHDGNEGFTSLAEASKFCRRTPGMMEHYLRNPRYLDRFTGHTRVPHAHGGVGGCVQLLRVQDADLPDVLDPWPTLAQAHQALTSASRLGRAKESK